jgi:hypothetical protein
MQRPRISIRWMMASVFVLALALGLGLPAIEVYGQPEYHLHGHIGLSNANPIYQWNSQHRSPFWQRYARRLMRQPWRKGTSCGEDGGLLEETCVLDHPEMVGEIICRGPALMPTPAMSAAFDKLTARSSQEPTFPSHQD